MLEILIKRVHLPADLEKCLFIRSEVFIKEQNVSTEDEIDGKDNKSNHYLIFADDIPVGTARVQNINNIAKIERVAVLLNYRNYGLGKKLMQFIINDLSKDKNINKIILSSQVSAINFYKSLGFIVCSEEYLDAGILHLGMELKIN